MMMKIGKMRDDKKYIGRGIVNILVGIVVSFLLSAVSLYFATDKYGIEMFQSYFENGYIVFLNTLPVFFSIMFVFLICNELWIGISITSILVIVLSLINYFKLLFRDDPLLVEDLTLFSEMKNMTGRYKIHINRDMILWILGMTVVIFVVWKLRKIIKIEMQIRTRIISVIMIVLCGISCMNQFILNDEYYQKTENIALINRWGGTQQFISRGFIYPFLYTMTVFYIILMYIWKLTFPELAVPVSIEAVVWISAIVRIVICLFPQNNWCSDEGNLKLSVIRNAVFAVTGIGIIILYAMSGNTYGYHMTRMVAAIIISFGCYLPVTLFSKTKPKVGLLMIPKTCAYMWIIAMGLQLLF